MLKVERISVMNMENAIRGARNPLNSWARMDSYYNEKGDFILGENDLSLATKLARAGSDHRKYLRQIMVSMDNRTRHHSASRYDHHGRTFRSITFSINT